MSTGARAALLIIDMQKAIDDPKWGRRGQLDAEQNAAVMLSAWRTARWPVIHVRHDSSESSSPYRPDLPGNEFKPEVAPRTGEIIVAKRTNSAFIGTELSGHLREMRTNRIVVGGVLLENSVEATVRMAGNLGYDVTLVEDAVASIDRVDRTGNRWSAEQVHALTLSILDGEYAVISNSRAIVEAME